MTKASGSSTVKSKKPVREMIKVFGGGFFLSLLVIVAAYQFAAPAPPRQLTIAAGMRDGAYFAFAQKYKRLYERQGIELIIQETTGSVENLRLLAEGEVELAFLQGGIGSGDDYPDLKGLASVYFEPLWIFVRKGYEINFLNELKAKKVAVGSEGSGTRKIVSQLIADNGLEGQLELLPLGPTEGAEELLGGNIDALCVVSSSESVVVRRLISDARVSLLNLRRAEAYSRLHNYLSHVVLPEGVLDLGANIPQMDFHLIAPAATLVAGKSMHPALIDLFMQVVDEVHEKGDEFSGAVKFPSPGYLDFDLSKEAERYYQHGPPLLQRFMPFWAASLIDRLKFMLLPLVALLVPLIKVLPPTYRWRIRSKIYRWYDELHELDTFTHDNLSAQTIQDSLATLERMDDEVRQVEVPLSYAEELYNLRLHIDLLRKQFTRLTTG